MSINKTFPSLIKTINEGKGKRMSTSFTQEIALPSFLKVEVIINGLKEFIHGFKGFLEIRRKEKEMKKRQEVKKTSLLRVIESSKFRKNRKSRKINIDETESFENQEDSKLEASNGEFNVSSSEVQEFSEEQQTRNSNSNEITNQEDEILIEQGSNHQDQSANANFVEIASPEVETPKAPEYNQQAQSSNVQFDKEQQTNNRRGRKSQLTLEMKNTLLDYFKKEKYPKSAQIENLANLTKQTTKYVKNWFTRERKKSKLQVEPTSIQQVHQTTVNLAEIANQGVPIEPEINQQTNEEVDFQAVLESNPQAQLAAANFAVRPNQETVPIEPEKNHQANTKIAEKTNEEVDFQEVFESNPQAQSATTNFTETPNDILNSTTISTSQQNPYVEDLEFSEIMETVVETDTNSNLELNRENIISSKAKIVSEIQPTTIQQVHQTTVILAEIANQEGVPEPENNHQANTNIAEKANEEVDFQVVLESNPQAQSAAANFTERYNDQVFIQASKDVTNFQAIKNYAIQLENEIFEKNDEIKELKILLEASKSELLTCVSYYKVKFSVFYYFALFEILNNKQYYIY